MPVQYCPRCKFQVNYGEDLCGSCGCDLAKMSPVSSQASTGNGPKCVKCGLIQSSTGSTYCSDCGHSLITAFPLWGKLAIATGIVFAAAFFGIIQPTMAKRHAALEAEVTRSGKWPVKLPIQVQSGEYWPDIVKDAEPIAVSYVRSMLISPEGNGVSQIRASELKDRSTVRFFGKARGKNQNGVATDASWAVTIRIIPDQVARMIRRKNPEAKLLENRATLEDQYFEGNLRSTIWRVEGTGFGLPDSPAMEPRITGTFPRLSTASVPKDIDPWKFMTIRERRIVSGAITDYAKSSNISGEAEQRMRARPFSFMARQMESDILARIEYFLTFGKMPDVKEN